MKAKLVFHETICDTEANLENIVRSLNEHAKELHAIPAKHLINYFNELVDYWQETGLTKKHAYMKNITEFLGKKNLLNSLEVPLHGNVNVLDEFVDIGLNNMMIHAQPRGLAVQWLAGNVSILGLFSIFSALLTKNTTLVKASSRGYEDLISILDTLHSFDTKDVKGKSIAKAIAVIIIDRNETEKHTYISKKADVRIAWGGHEAIETITQLDKSTFTEDITFGPKYSFALIDNDSLKENQAKLAQRLAIDASVFDQYACSSPHTVFVEEKQEGEAIEFAKALAKGMDMVHRTMLPKASTEAAKSAEIFSLRTEYELLGNVFSSKDTAWTVIYTDEPGLAQSCFDRVVFVKPIKDIMEIASFTDRQKQTLTVAMTDKNKAKYLDEITRNGIDRCPDLGYATYFESPWDGMFIFDRLVRWVSTYKSQS